MSYGQVIFIVLAVCWLVSGFVMLWPEVALSIGRTKPKQKSESHLAKESSKELSESTKYSLHRQIIAMVELEFNQGNLPKEVVAHPDTVRRIWNDWTEYEKDYGGVRAYTVITSCGHIWLRGDPTMPEHKMVLHVKKAPPPPYRGPVTLTVERES